MNTKSFVASGLVAFILNFLLGWLFYGIIFPDLMPSQGEENMLFVALGCLFSGLLMSYIFTCVTSITSFNDGFKIGAVFGLLNALSMNFFMYSSMEPNYQNIGIDVAITLIMGGIVGGVIGIINGKMTS